MIALVCSSLALAASWSIGVPLDRAVEPGGDLVVPAGVAVRLVFTPAGAPVLSSADGAEVAVQALSDGALIPAAGTTRTLHVAAPAGARVWVHTASAADGAHEWDVWAGALDRWLRGPHTAASTAASEPVLPAPPWGGERVRAGIVLRRRALTDPELVRMGALRELTLARPIEGAGFRAATPAGSIVGRPVHVEGPGLLLLAVRTGGDGEVVRTRVDVVLGDVKQEPIDVAATGAAPLTVRRWLPPGTHRLEAMPTDPATSVTATVLQLRPHLLSRLLSDRPSTQPARGARPRDEALDLAERLWLDGERAAAGEVFATRLDAPGAAGELARARWMEVAPAAELEALARPPADVSPEGRELLADAALRRADELPPELVLDLVLGARDPDLVGLARWLDGLGGARAAGLALLSSAAPPVPWGPSPAVRAVREAALGTRWTTLAPDPGPPRGAPVLAETGPGIPRLRLAAGAVAPILLPDPGHERFPVLRLRADGPVRYRVDGELRASLGGDLDEALPAGPHTIAVDTGALVLLDPNVATTEGASEGAAGATPLYEQRPALLPARWTLGDPGVDGWIRVSGDGAMRVRFDDGTEVAVAPGTDGRPTPIRVPAHSTSFTVEGAAGAPAWVAVRSPLFATTEPERLVVGPDPLADLARTSRAIDAGDVTARLERARILGALGLRTSSRRDLGVLLTGPDEALAAGAAEVWRATGSYVATAPVVGPRTVAAARARAPNGDEGVLAQVSGQGVGVAASPRPPEVPDATDAAWLYVLAGEARLAEGELSEAWHEAKRAGPAGEDLLVTLGARTRWVPVRRGDSGQGLVTVPTAAEAPPETLVGRTRAAMLAAPWDPATGHVIRGDLVEVIRPGGASVELDLFCRDEVGPGAPCATTVRLDGEPRAVTIADGATRTIALSGAREVELEGPGVGKALVARTRRGGRVFSVSSSRTALRASHGNPVVATVAGGAPLRIEVLRGAARVEADGRTLELDEEGRGVLPVLTREAVTVRVIGDADVVLARGELREVLPVPEWPAPEPPPPSLPRAAIAPLLVLGAASASSAVERTLPGTGGSTRLRAGAVHDVRPGSTPWDAGELEGEWLRTVDDTWVGASAWVRGPRLAMGAAFSGARTWEDGWIRGTLEGAAGEPVLAWDRGGATGGAPVSAHGGASVEARHDLRITPDADLRASGRVAGGWFSAPPDGAIDPRAWTRWGLEHPLTASVGAEVVARPWRDVQLHLGADALSNTGPSLDRARAFGKAWLLVGDAAVFGAEATLARRFADVHRLEATWEPRLGLTADVGVWTGKGRRIEAGTTLAYTPDGFEGQLGLSVLWSDGRGFHDLPPGAETFRGARDLY